MINKKYPKKTPDRYIIKEIISLSLISEENSVGYIALGLNILIN